MEMALLEENSYCDINFERALEVIVLRVFHKVLINLKNFAKNLSSFQSLISKKIHQKVSRKFLTPFSIITIKNFKLKGLKSWICPCLLIPLSLLIFYMLKGKKAFQFGWPKQKINRKSDLSPKTKYCKSFHYIGHSLIEKKEAEKVFKW